jgi:hypothetical protein
LTLETLTGLGYIDRLQGQFEQTADQPMQALQIARAVCHCTGELDALVGLGRASLAAGAVRAGHWLPRAGAAASLGCWTLP